MEANKQCEACIFFDSCETTDELCNDFYSIYDEDNEYAIIQEYGDEVGEIQWRVHT